jgi:gluconolactonase
MASDRIEVLASGLGFLEGPVIRQDGSIAVVSIDRGTLYEIAPSGSVVELAVAEAGLNGATEGEGETMYLAHFYGAPPAPAGVRSTGGLLAWTPDRGIDWISRDPVSPNDLCVGPEGSVYLTDPTRRQRADGRLWRCDPATGAAELLRSVDWYPNGIGFGADPDVLFVASSFAQQIVRIPIEASGGVAKGEVVIQMTEGVPDGFAFDTEGNLIIAAPSMDHAKAGTIQTWSMRGELLDVFRPGKSRLYTNVALSTDGVLYITDADEGALLRVDDWPTRGLALHPFR